MNLRWINLSRRGWHNDRYEHSLASKGIKTRKSKAIVKDDAFKFEPGEKLIVDHPSKGKIELQIKELNDQFDSMQDLADTIEERLRIFFNKLSDYYNIREGYTLTVNEGLSNAVGGIMGKTSRLGFPPDKTSLHILLHEWKHILDNEQTIRESEESDLSTDEYANEEYEELGHDLELDAHKWADKNKDKWIDLYKELDLNYLSEHYSEIKSSLNMAEQFDSMGGVIERK